MSRVPSATNPSGAGFSFQVPSPRGGDPVPAAIGRAGAQSLGAATDLLTQLGRQQRRAKQAKQVSETYNSALDTISAAEEAAVQAEAGEQLETFEQRVQPLRQSVESIEDPEVRREAQTAVESRIRSTQRRLRRVQSERLKQDNANERAEQSGKLIQEMAVKNAGDPAERREAFEAFGNLIDSQIAGGVLREEQKPELMREFRSRFVATELNNLAAEDPEVALDMLAEGETQSVLSDSQVRVFRRMAERNGQRLDRRQRSALMGDLSEGLNEVMLADEFDPVALRNTVESFREQASGIDSPPTDKDVLEVMRPHLTAAANDPDQGLRKLSALEGVLPETAEAQNALSQARDRLDNNLQKQEQVESQAGVLMRAAAGEDVGELPDSPDAVDEFYDQARQHQSLAQVTGFLAENGLPMPDAALSELNGSFSPAGGFDFASGVSALRAIERRNPDRLKAVISGMADSRLGESADPALVRAALSGTEGLEPGTDAFEERVAPLHSANGRKAVSDAVSLMPGGENDAFQDAGFAFFDIGMDDLLNKGGLEVDRVTASMEQRFADAFRFELAREAVRQDRAPGEVTAAAGERAGQRVAASMTRIRPDGIPLQAEQVEGLSDNGLDALRQAMDTAESRFDPGLLSLEGRAREDLMLREGERVTVPVMKDGDFLGAVQFNATNHTSQFITRENERFGELQQKFRRADRSQRDVIEGLDAANADPMAPTDRQRGKPLVRFKEKRQAIWDRAMQRFVESQDRQPEPGNEEDQQLVVEIYEQIAREKGWDQIYKGGR